MTSCEPFVSPTTAWAIPPILRNLRVVAAALITRDGVLCDANSGFLRILPNEMSASALLDVRHLFVQPRFDEFAARSANTQDGSVYRGILSIGDTDIGVCSLLGAIYDLANHLLLIAEHDVVQLETNVQKLQALNDELAASQREVARLERVLERRESKTRGAIADRDALLHLMSRDSEVPRSPSPLPFPDRRGVPAELDSDLTFEWTETMSTGITSLDTEHKELIRLYLAAIQALSIDRDLKRFRSRLLTFRDTASRHFAHEERVMKATSFRFYDEHKREHDGMLQEIDRILGIVDSPRSFDEGRKIASFIRSSLVRHGSEQDRRIGALLR